MGVTSGTRIGGGNRKDWLRRLKRNGFAQSDGGTAIDWHVAIDAAPRSLGAGTVGNLS